jgi:hypothetical protein
MIVWLASYPRSGNTLARQMLRQAFDCESYSQYNDPLDIGGRPEVAAAVGHRSYAGPWQAFLEEARTSVHLHLIKTHHAPQDDAPAIYLVRDGRSAAVSFYHLLRDVRGREDVTLEQVIEGRTPFGSWGSHLDAWQPLDRPRTLLLRFEDLTDRPQQAIAALAAFLDRRPVAEWRNDLEHLQDLFPGFFRAGSDTANLAEMDDACRTLFESRHGPWLRRLGYSA